jgi:hypothetical protein
LKAKTQVHKPNLGHPHPAPGFLCEEERFLDTNGRRDLKKGSREDSGLKAKTQVHKPNPGHPATRIVLCSGAVQCATRPAPGFLCEEERFLDTNGRRDLKKGSREDSGLKAKTQVHKPNLGHPASALKKGEDEGAASAKPQTARMRKISRA